MGTGFDGRRGLDTDELAKAAAERSRLYAFLGRVFGAEQTAASLDDLERLEAAGALAASGVSVGDAVLRPPRDQVVEALAVEYARLFIGPGPHIAPYASVHSPRGSGSLWDAPAADVKAFIEAAGYEFSADYRGLPDHVSVVLDFMASMTGIEAEAWAVGDAGRAAEVLRLEEQFLDEHLLSWVPAFCERAVEAADLSFYREMAALTSDYVRFDREEVARTLLLT